MIPARLKKSTSRISELGTGKRKAITEKAVRLDNAVKALEDELSFELTATKRDVGQIDLIRARIATKKRELVRELAGSSR